jgi:hypothetical protein
MGYTLQFAGEDGRVHTEHYPTTVGALARWSELMSPPVNRPLVYVTDDRGRDFTGDELEELVKKESGDA